MPKIQKCEHKECNNTAQILTKEESSVEHSEFFSCGELEDSLVNMRLSSSRAHNKLLDIKKLESSATGRYDARYRDSVMVSDESDTELFKEPHRLDQRMLAGQGQKHVRKVSNLSLLGDAD